MTYPAEFIYSNLAVQPNVIQAAHQQGVQQLLFGSSVFTRVSLHSPCAKRR